MYQENETIHCKNCGVEIIWLPIVEDHYLYCCQDCLHGLACECIAIFELDDDRAVEGSPIINLLSAYTG